jgi:peptide/bleomycin uptake transporter
VPYARSTATVIAQARQHDLCSTIDAADVHGRKAMVRAFFASKKWCLWAYGGGLFILASLYGQVYAAVLVNEWYRTFFDMLQRPDAYTLDEFWKSLTYWVLITGPFWILAAATNYVMRLYTLSWREAITFNYLPRWQHVTRDIEGASQRIQEDTFRFTRIMESLGVEIAQAVMTLIAFVPVLWNLSRAIDVGWVKNSPGLLVWASLLISIGGLGISWMVGIKLPKLEYDNQKAEAAFRKQLVLAEDDKLHYAATYDLLNLFMNIKVNYRRLFMHYGYFDVWINLYDYFVTITPYLILGPGVFVGIITLGLLQQVVHAFEKVHTSLSLFLHNWTVITEVRSIRLRLREFEMHLEEQQNRAHESALNNVIPFPLDAARDKQVPQSWERRRRVSPLSVRVTLRRFSQLFGSRNEETGP